MKVMEEAEGVMVSRSRDPVELREGPEPELQSRYSKRRKGYHKRELLQVYSRSRTICPRLSNFSSSHAIVVFQCGTGTRCVMSTSASISLRECNKCQSPYSAG